MKKNSLSIRKKSLILSILVPIVLILLMAGGLFVIQFQKNLENAKVLLGSNSTIIQNQISAELLVSFELLRNLAANPLTGRVAQRMDQVPEGVDNDDFAGLSEFESFTDLMERSSRHTNADLVYLAGINSRGLILSQDTQLGATFDVRQRDYYQGAQQNLGTPVLSQPRVSAQETAEPLIVVTAALAVQNDLGRPLGVVSLNYSFNRITDIVRQLMVDFDVLITLYDTIDNVVLGTETDEGFVFYDPENPITLLDWVQSLGFSGNDALVKVDEITTLDSVYLEGQTPLGQSMIETVRVPGTRWAIAVIDSRTDVVQRVISSILPPLGIFMGLFLLGQIMVYFLYLRLLVNPMVGLGKNLAELAEADADLRIQVPQTSNDEIGLVAASFNGFVSKLRGLMEEVKVAIEGTATIKQNISSATEETTSAVEEISANLKSIGEQMRVLDDNINENSSVIEEISQNIASVDTQILNQSSMVEQSTAAITQMIASLESVNQVAQTKGRATRNLSSVAEEGKQRIQKTADNFGQVVQQINLVQEMATAINSIAAQTNLLSMNAAIEAAHAGDAGRGFAVVAEEIRNLADSAGTSSKKITSLIRDITKAVGTTDENVRRTSEAFESISQEVSDTIDAFAEIEHAVSELNEGGRQILESTNQISEVTIQIRTGSQEMKTGTDMMLQSSSTIKDISSRVSHGMAESTTGVEEIVEAMQQVLGLTVELNTIVGQLKNNFERFKT